MDLQVLEAGLQEFYQKLTSFQKNSLKKQKQYVTTDGECFVPPESTNVSLVLPPLFQIIVHFGFVRIQTWGVKKQSKLFNFDQVYREI